MTKEPSESLKTGRRELEGVKTFSIEKDLFWHEKVGTWVIECRLDLADLKCENLKNTRWCLRVSEEYPFGSAEYYPHEDSTLVQTYPHQDLNLPPEPGTNWRKGKPCLDLSNKALRAEGISDEDEPYTVEHRLYWRTLRLIAWLRAADEDQLSKDGDPFELPPYPVNRSDWTIGFVEDEDSMAEWAKVTAQFGYANAAKVTNYVLAVKSFQDRSNTKCLDVSFGRSISQASAHARPLLWLRTKSLPIIVPWQPPLTWGSLRSSLKEQSVDLDEILKSQAAHLVGEGQILLIGAPISRLIGNEPSQMHWLAIELPELPKKTKGFRNTPSSLWTFYRSVPLNDSAEIKWADSENWAGPEINNRGIFSEALCSKTIAVIGAGALGSIVSECLVRGGVRRVLLIDKDGVEIGNLSRHSLDLTHLGRRKCLALAEKLNRAGPFNDVEGIAKDIRRLSKEETQKLYASDLILDCTGNSDVLEFFERQPFPSQKRFVSVSLGAYGHCLYYYSAKDAKFPFSDFREKVSPALLEDRRKFPEEKFPRDGIGCWHYVFPARYDQVAAWGPVVSQLLDAAVNTDGEEIEFKVITAKEISGE